MKKTLAILAVVLMVFAVNAATSVQAGDSLYAKPIDIDTVILHDQSASSSDTFDAGECRVYGPFRVTAENGQPMYKGFAVYAKAITGTSPTMTFDYQLLPTYSVADTTALWTSCGDTLDGTGVHQYVDMSSMAGRSIVFRVYNYDGTESVIPNWLMVEFKKNFTYNK